MNKFQIEKLFESAENFKKNCSKKFADLTWLVSTDLYRYKSNYKFESDTFALLVCLILQNENSRFDDLDTWVDTCVYYDAE